MMHSSSSRNHPQVQVAAGRAVVRDPSSAAASAAVHPRARDSSGSSHDPPRSTATRDAGERPSKEEEINTAITNIVAILPPQASYYAAADNNDAPIPPAQIGADHERRDAAIKESMKTPSNAGDAIDAILPPLASCAAAAADNDEAPIPPAHIGADCERRDAAIKESIKTPSNVEDAPMHPSQIAAHYGNTEKAIKESIKYANSSGSGTDPPLPPSQIAAVVEKTEDDEEHELKKKVVPTTEADGDTPPPSLTPSNAEDAPMHPSQIAADFGNMFDTIKESIKDANSSYSGMHAPLPPSQIAALIRKTEDGEENGLEKKAAPMSEVDGDAPPPSLLAVPQIVEQEETLQQEQDPPTPAVAREPSPPPIDQGRSPSNPRGQQEVPVRPPPQSVVPSPDDDANPPVSALPQATPVEDQPESPVYDAFQVAEQTWLKKKKKYIFGGLGLFVGAVTAGVSISSNNGTSDSNTVEPEGIVLLSSPSKSLIPSFQPSTSLSPSETPSSSLRPSLLPSSPPSTYWSSFSWRRQGTGLDGEASVDRFGEAVAFSADALTMAVGAPGYSSYGSTGYVKVYHREGEASSWEQRGNTIHGEANGDNFGFSLALSDDGTILSIGAPRHDSMGVESGQVKIYKWVVGWDYVIWDTLYGSASRDHFGHSLDISNNMILAVGAKYSSANGRSSGQVTVYIWDEASSKFQHRGEAIDGFNVFEEFGSYVSLAENGQKLAVYALGVARVFEWNKATSNYVQLGDSLPAGICSLQNGAALETPSSFNLLLSFSRDGTTLATIDQCEIKIFAWDKVASNFEQIGQILSIGRPISVVLSSEGKTLAIGAGSYVKVYGWDDASSEYKLLGQSLSGEAYGRYGLRFGQALALARNGRVLAVGNPSTSKNGINSGSVEVFDIEL